MYISMHAVRNILAGLLGVVVFTARATETSYPPSAEAKPTRVHSIAKLVLHDGKRNKDLQVRITWPDAPRPVPVIVWSHGITGSKDGPTRTGQPAEWRKKPYELSPPGDKYLVCVEGLDHGYGGITGVRFNLKNHTNPDHVRWTKIATLAFWDAFLKNNGEAKHCLQGSQLEIFTHGALKLLRK